ncbi:hypothetical protein [Massilia phyllosphaerae]|uniref:hypothetical protein n=1 Tax=Massilia phyllosphaerae TaxID=3106034 RepID=UPI002B1CB9A2|nr:hypothetical protein [Massilia sp. SGZ-792]
MTKMSVRDLHNEIANHLGQISDLFVPGMKLTFMARMVGNNEADVVVSDDNEPEEMIAIVRRRFSLDAPVESVPIPTSTDMARLMLGLSYRYLQENAPENLAGAAPTQPKAQVESIDTPEFGERLADLIDAYRDELNGGPEQPYERARAALIDYIYAWAGSRAGDAVPAK